MKNKAVLIRAIHDDLQRSLKKHMNNTYFENIGDFDCGQAAMKRKITYLRRELLNLEKEIMNASITDYPYTKS